MGHSKKCLTSNERSASAIIAEHRVVLLLRFRRYGQRISLNQDRASTLVFKQGGPSGGSGTDGIPRSRPVSMGCGGFPTTVPTEQTRKREQHELDTKTCH